MAKRRYLDELLEKHKDTQKAPAEFINFMGIAEDTNEQIEAAWALTKRNRNLPSRKMIWEYLNKPVEGPSLRQNATAGHVATLWVKTTFEGLHRHPVHPLGHFAWLTGWHRHIFHVEVGVHYTPHIEGHELKDHVDDYIKSHWHKTQLDQKRAYELAAELLTHFNAAYVIVSEEGECGVCLIASEGE